MCYPFFPGFQLVWCIFFCGCLTYPWIIFLIPCLLWKKKVMTCYEPVVDETPLEDGSFSEVFPPCIRLGKEAAPWIVRCRELTFVKNSSDSSLDGVIPSKFILNFLWNHCIPFCESLALSTSITFDQTCLVISPKKSSDWYGFVWTWSIPTNTTQIAL